MNWWYDEPLLPQLTVYEEEKSPVVIYDHTGQPYSRPKPPMGFIDPANPPRAAARRGRKIKDQS
ncbi:hypothetical protein [Zavarzinella formosa]|uniref:hypothetical protein n=1 Tax=Zavarzinella formosa TaxID=360055 RepID=UPI000300C85C|nr:hypothetical protein [Zavarzinella formosa]